MTIKNLGYIPNCPNPLSLKKAEQINTQNSQQNAAKLNKVSVPSRTDTIEISQKRVTSRPALSHVRDQILTDLNADSDSAFLEELKGKIDAGEYKVDSGEIAKILLSGKE